jgi:hypothetical protein
MGCAGDFVWKEGARRVLARARDAGLERVVRGVYIYIYKL